MGRIVCMILLVDCLSTVECLGADNLISCQMAAVEK